jgi:cysteine desulfurase
MTIYFDNNASTQIHPTVAKAMQDWNNGKVYGNPHAGHYLGKLARDAMDLAREQVLSLFGLGVENFKCLFTSGASESNNMALKGLVFNQVRNTRSANITILTSSVEHSTIDKCLEWMTELFNVKVIFVDVDEHGILCMDSLNRVLVEQVDRVDIMTCIHCVAETGAIQPIKEICDLVKSKFPQSIFHCDASQSIGKVSSHVLTQIGQSVDMITIAGHKFGGPKGSGALIVKEHIANRMDPLIHGAGQEYGLRGGTENVANIVGLGAACALAHGRECPSAEILNKLRQILSSEFEKNGVDYRINSTAKHQSPYTLNISVAGMSGPCLVAALGNKPDPEPSICFSAGSACHSRGPPAPSKVLKAMNVPHKYSISAIRLSICAETTEEHVQDAGFRIAAEICKHIAA